MPPKMLPALAGISVFAALVSAPANAEMTLSIYGGFQSAPHSEVKVSDEPDFTAGWEGKSFSMPPYYGARATWWLEDFGRPNLGLSIDYTHAKVYADDETLTKSGWDHFEFTDGINLLTVNALYRMPIGSSKFVPYIGAGVGINIPHVEVRRNGNETREYQFGGPTVQSQVGVAYRFTEAWSAFVEYKATIRGSRWISTTTRRSRPAL